MLRIPRLVACVLAAYLLQACVLHRVSYGYMRTDLMALFAIFLALEADYRPALRASFVLGLLRDFGSDGRIGVGPLMFVPVVAGLMAVREYVLRESPWTDLILTLTCLLAINLPPALMGAAVTDGAQLGPLLLSALGTVLLTTLIAPIFFVLLHRAGVVDTSVRTFGPE